MARIVVNGSHKNGHLTTASCAYSLYVLFPCFRTSVSDRSKQSMQTTAHWQRPSQALTHCRINTAYVHILAFASVTGILFYHFVPFVRSPSGFRVCVCEKQLDLGLMVEQATERANVCMFNGNVSHEVGLELMKRDKHSRGAEWISLLLHFFFSPFFHVRRQHEEIA